MVCLVFHFMFLDSERWGYTHTPVAMERVRKRLKTQRIEMRCCEKECARISKERR